MHGPSAALRQAIVDPLVLLMARGARSRHEVEDSSEVRDQISRWELAGGAVAGQVEVSHATHLGNHAVEHGYGTWVGHFQPVEIEAHSPQKPADAVDNVTRWRVAGGRVLPSSSVVTPRPACT